MYIIDQFNTHNTESILITMTPTASYTVGFNLTFASGTLTIDWKDGSSTENFVSGVELTHTYTSASTYVAEITGDLGNITRFIADNNRITSISGLKTGLLTDLYLYNNLYSGTLDLSDAPVSNFVYLYLNSGLTGITFASSGNGNISRMWIDQCNFSSLDFSNLTFSSGQLRAYSNSNLTSVTFSTGSNSLNNLDLGQCNITGTLDLSNTTVSLTVDLASNSNMTGVTFASSGNSTVSNLDLSGCNFSSLDFSNVPLQDYIYLYSNSSLSSVTFGSTNGNILRIWAHSCDLGYTDITSFSMDVNTSTVRFEDNNMVVAEVNHMLVDGDTISSSGYTGRAYNISGTNAAPDGSSGGYDGLTAKSNMQADGITVTTN